MYKFKFSVPRLTFLFKQTTSVLNEVLQFTSPVDKLLSNFFKIHKKIGQIDRAFISESVFIIIKNKSLVEYFCGKNIGITIKSDKLLLAALKIFQIVELSPEFINEINIKNNEKLWLQELPNFRDLFDENASSPKNIQENIKPEILFSFPEFLYNKFLQIFNNNPQNLHKFLLFQNSSASLDLRVNTYKIKREKLVSKIFEELPNLNKQNLQHTEFSPLGLRLVQKIALNKLSVFLNGEIEVQDQASQIIGLLVDAKRRQMVADFCAGAGGKTLLLGSQMQNSGNLYAFDIDEKRLNRLKPRLARSGLSNIHPVKLANLNDNRLKRLAAKFDRVLVDAPCSGMGTLRRNPDLKWRQTPEKISELTNQQQQILNSASKLVKSGGRLIYATCSLLPEENAEQIHKFLQNQPNFKIVNIKNELSSAINNAEKFFAEIEKFPYFQKIVENGFFTSIPQIHNCDGFFAAVLQKI